MASDPNSVENAVSRTLRDNLEKIQRTADELHKAVNDMVSACASSRASNVLPSMLRAQTSAASLSATLEVLSRFVTSALQPSMRMPFEAEAFHVPSMSATPVPALELPPPPPLPTPPAHAPKEISWATPVQVVQPPRVPEIPPAVEQIPAIPAIPSPEEVAEFSDDSAAVEMSAPADPAPTIEPIFLPDPVPVTLHDPAPVFDLDLPVQAPPQGPSQAAAKPVEAAAVFNLDSLPPEEQELHRRAFRVAKVSMQDIRMLRPEDVRLGRENKDLCSRLRDDIEKAHKEYDRRFQPIRSHPVDYFYDWMVEILGGGDPQALGEYPYPSPVLRR
jgi:hypothetical protein